MTLPDTEHLRSTKTTISTGMHNFLTTIRNIGRDKSGENDPARVHASDLSTPFIRTTTEEEELVQSLRTTAAETGNNTVATVDTFWILAAIRARKGDINRALPLITNYMAWRESLESNAINPSRNDIIQQQLLKGVFLVTGNTDRDGRPVLTVRMRYHDPSVFSALDTVRTISAIIEWMLRTIPKSQTHGIVMVHDMAELRPKNVDFRLPAVLQKAFSRNFPVRLAAFHIIHPPIFVRAIANIMMTVMGEKLKARIRIYVNGDQDKLMEMFTSENILENLNLGGSAVWSDQHQIEWVKQVVKTSESWD